MQKENLYKLDKIIKEIDFIFEQTNGKLMQALKNEIKQKAIFMSIINIKETIKNIQDSADTEVMIIFREEDMKRLSKSRNIAAHDSQAMNLNIVTNLIRYDLPRLKQSIINFKNNPSNLHFIPKEENVKKRTLKSLEALIIFLFVCILSCIVFIVFFLLNKPPKNIKQENSSYNFHKNYFYPLEPFILNLPQAGRQKYIRCTIELELIKEIALEDFTKISPVIRDTIIQTIPAKEIQEIEFSNFKLELQRELVKKINEKLGNKLIKELYFRDFIIS